MEINYNMDDLEIYINKALKVSEDNEILIDQYLENAIEIDVDAICTDLPEFWLK